MNKNQKIAKGNLLPIYMRSRDKGNIRAIKKRVFQINKYLKQEGIGYEDTTFEQVISLDINLLTGSLYTVFVVEKDRMEEVKEMFFEGLNKRLKSKVSVTPHYRKRVLRPILKRELVAA